MTTTYVSGAMELRALAVRLKAAGEEGKGLRRKLNKQMNKSVKPLAEKVADVEHLKPYMPDRYALVLAADLGVRISNTFGAATPRVEVRAKARQHKRKVVLLDAGRINHPIYARGERKTWRWSNAQAGGMRPGFFSDAVRDETSYIRDQVAKAMTETAREITGK